MTQDEIMQRMRLLGSAIQINGDVGQLNMGDGTYYAQPPQDGVRQESSRYPQGNADSHEAEALATKQADKYWRRLQKGGFTEAGHRLSATTTRAEAAYIADYFSEKLGIKSKWRTFERLWGISNLAQEMYKSRETGKMPPRGEEIAAIFAD